MSADAPKPARFQRQTPRRKPKDDRFTRLPGEDHEAAMRRMLTEGMPEVSRALLESSERATSKRVREQARRTLHAYAPRIKPLLRDLAEQGRTETLRAQARRSLAELEKEFP